jgi:hypothetical protein
MLPTFASPETGLISTDTLAVGEWGYFESVPADRALPVPYLDWLRGAIV